MYIWEMNYGSEESEPIRTLCMDRARLNRIRHKCCFVHKFKSLMLLHASHHEVLIGKTVVNRLSYNGYLARHLRFALVDRCGTGYSNNNSKAIISSN